MSTVLMLSNTYDKRKQSESLFAGEYAAIVNEITKVKYKGVKGVSVAASEIFAHRSDHNMLYAHIVILNSDGKRCVVVELRIDGTLQYWKYQFESGYKNAETLLRSRFAENAKPLNGKRGDHEISLEEFCAAEVPFSDFLQLPLPVVVE